MRPTYRGHCYFLKFNNTRYHVLFYATLAKLTVAFDTIYKMNNSLKKKFNIKVAGSYFRVNGN